MESQKPAFATKSTASSTMGTNLSHIYSTASPQDHNAALNHPARDGTGAIGLDVKEGTSVEEAKPDAVGLDVKEGTSVEEAKPIVPLTEFTLFSDLPGEIRSKIWRLAIPPTERLVRIRTSGLHWWFCPEVATPVWKPVTSDRYKGPALLATSSEARAEGLTGAVILKSKVKDACTVPMYFHLKDDILCAADRGTRNKSLSAVLSHLPDSALQLRKLAISEKVWMEWEELGRQEDLLRLSGLKLLIVVDDISGSIINYRGFAPIGGNRFDDQKRLVMDIFRVFKKLRRENPRYVAPRLTFGSFY